MPRKGFPNNPGGTGGFKPGQSGNPGGRPKGLHDLAKLAQTYTSEAVNTLATIMKTGAKDSDRINASTALLDRGYGKASQSIDHNVESTGPLVAVIQESKDPK